MRRIGSVVLVGMALTTSAHAAEKLEGSRIRASYGEVGLWNDKATGAGLQVRHGETWVDYSYPGYPYAAWFLRWEDGGSAPESYFAESNVPETNGVLLAEEDLSTETMRVARHTYQVGAATLRKTEAWAVDGSAILMHFYVTNGDSRTLSNLRLLYALDPDQDTLVYGANTLNDTIDLDGDGTADAATSAGPNTGHTVVFGACPSVDVEIGHYGSWSYERNIDVALVDGAGTESDSAVGIRMSAVGALVPGETTQLAFVVAVGDTLEQAVAVLGEQRALCADCDADADGWLAPACGGTDCDDDDPDANPDEIEVWYDGIDGDCDGGSDFDADADGHDTVASGGGDCDDADPAVGPGAVDAPYDGIDADCAGDSDLDADGDGFDSGGHGGDDCNDADGAVHPGAADTEGDGLDADCDGNDAPAPTELVGGCGCETGRGPAGLAGLAGMILVALRRRRR